eukprot:350500-Chlamydomonas_euryale.AAC.7
MIVRLMRNLTRQSSPRCQTLCSSKPALVHRPVAEYPARSPAIISHKDSRNISLPAQASRDTGCFVSRYVKVSHRLSKRQPCTHLTNGHGCALMRSYDELLRECEQSLCDRGFIPEVPSEGLPNFLDPVMLTFLDVSGDHQVHQRELLAAQTKATEFSAQADPPLVPLPDDWPTLLKAVCKGIPDSFLRKVLPTLTPPAPYTAQAACLACQETLTGAV